MSKDLLMELLRVLGPLLWILLCFYLFLIYQRRRDQYKFEMEKQIKRQELEYQMYLSH
jgi:hypothetical protein